MNLQLWRITQGPRRRSRDLLLLPLLLLPFAVGAFGGELGLASPERTVLAPTLEQVSLRAPANQQADGADHSGRKPSRNTVYTVINMGEEGDMTSLLNSRSQVVFGHQRVTGMVNRFFDGDRFYDIGSLGGGHTIARALNVNGVVTGYSTTAGLPPFDHVRAFTWTVSEGIRALEGGRNDQGSAINDKRQVAGFAQIDGLSARATRWNPKGSIGGLEPRPLSLSQADDINQDGTTAGFADVASGAIHAMRWKADGTWNDLGTLGGSRAFGQHINAYGHIAGTSESTGDERVLAFFWSPRAGMVPMGPEGGGVRLVAALNDLGEVVGNTQVGDLSLPYTWSRNRGLALLPLGGEVQGDAWDINVYGQMVGAIQTGFDWRLKRAVLWSGIGAPIELNTRLHRPPAGLRLYIGAAINAAGDILAHSNVGLVLLRPGRRGTNAPVIGPLQGLPEDATVGDSVHVKFGFTDSSPRETHTVNIDWGDGCPTTNPVVRQSRGGGEATATHTFCTFGFHMVTARVTDSGGRTTLLRSDVFVQSPSLAAVAGRGTLTALARAQPPLQFALWVPLDMRISSQAQPQVLAGANSAKPTVPFVELAGPFHFKSTSITSVERAAKGARIEAVGRLNGRAGYRVVLDAIDGGGTDRMRVRVSHRDMALKAEAVDYDSASPAVVGKSGAAMMLAAKGAALATTSPPPLAKGGITVRN